MLEMALAGRRLRPRGISLPCWDFGSEDQRKDPSKFFIMQSIPGRFRHKIERILRNKEVLNSILSVLREVCCPLRMVQSPKMLLPSLDRLEYQFSFTFSGLCWLPAEESCVILAKVAILNLIVFSLKRNNLNIFSSPRICRSEKEGPVSPRPFSTFSQGQASGTLTVRAPTREREEISISLTVKTSRNSFSFLTGVNQRDRFLQPALLTFALLVQGISARNFDFSPLQIQSGKGVAPSSQKTKKNAHRGYMISERWQTKSDTATNNSSA